MFWGLKLEIFGNIIIRLSFEKYKWLHFYSFPITTIINTKYSTNKNPKYIQNLIKNRWDFIQIWWHKRKWHFLWSCNFRMLIPIHEPFIFSIIFRENANAQTTSLSVCFKKAFHFSKQTDSGFISQESISILLNFIIITEVIYSLQNKCDIPFSLSYA